MFTAFGIRLKDHIRKTFESALRTLLIVRFYFCKCKNKFQRETATALLKKWKSWKDYRNEQLRWQQKQRNIRQHFLLNFYI